MTTRIAYAALAAFLLLPATLRAQDVPAGSDPDTTSATLRPSVLDGSALRFDTVRVREQYKRPIQLPSSTGIPMRPGSGAREDVFGGTASPAQQFSPSPQHGKALSAYGRAGIGAYVTPFAEGWYAQQFEKGDIGAHALLEHSQGHTEGADYTTIRLDANGGTFLPSTLHPLLARSRLEGEVHASNDVYRLYAEQQIIRETIALFIDRNVTGFTASATLATRGNSMLDYRASLFTSNLLLLEHVAPNLFYTPTSGRFVENRFGLRAEASKALLGHLLRADLSFSVSDLSLGASDYQGRLWYLLRLRSTDEALPPWPRPLFLALRAQTRHSFRDDLSIEGGLAACVFRGTRDATNARLYPFVTARYEFDQHIAAFATIKASVDEVSNASLLAENPYLMVGAEIRHRDTPFSLRLGVDYDDRNEVSGRITADYSLSTSQVRWEKDGSSDLLWGSWSQWKPVYDGYTSIFTLEGQGAWMLGERDRISAEAILRTTRNTVIHAALPFLAPIESKGSYTRELPYGINATGTLRFVGTRATGSGNLPAVLLARVEGEYRITQQFGAYACIDNLFGQRYEWWPGYVARPLFLSVAITVRF